MAYKNKYIKLEKNHYVFLRHKVTHPAWLSGIPFRYIVNSIKEGVIFKAKENV